MFVGLGILASEFAWAERLLNFAKAKVRGWTRWVRRRSALTRGLLGLATLALLGGLAWGYIAWQGVPFVAD